MADYMSKLNSFFASRWGIIFAGAFIGILAPLLVYWGNPKNMGICVACFERDIAGALGLHRADVVQYIRPEIIGFVLGALLAAVLFREFRARAGSAPIVRFALGVSAMIGALVFLGCPWRALLRLAGGDLNAILGLTGLVAGVTVGAMFIGSGYNLGRAQRAPLIIGLVLPAAMLGLLLLAIYTPEFGRDADGNLVGPIFDSIEGPGSLHPAIWVSLVVGIVVGVLAQRTRFCTMGAIRDVVLVRDSHLLSGVLALLAAAVVTNAVIHGFTDEELLKLGFADQPVAHDNHLWNFLGMALAGLCFALAGGCPGRQLFLSGEGDGDAAVFVLGMITGAAFAHNFNLASSPAGVSPYGPEAVVIGLVVAAAIGFAAMDKAWLMAWWKKARPRVKVAAGDEA
ncbi:MAG: YedE-related selenium metabolism membrane protein [Dehalococcoidia bacterium]|nr:MAG: YedE-related selenium metabolism membrane protein [Dehalococcoidia bacterium]